MKKPLLLSAIVVLLAYVQQPISPNRSDASPEEYAVYSALIANMFAGDKVTFDTQDKVKVLVIQDVTTTDLSFDGPIKDDQYFRQMFPTLTDGVGKDYIKRNNEPARLKDSFDLTVKRVLVEQKEITEIFKRHGWEEFYKRYPGSGGFIALSRVGFSPAMNQAVVYIQHSCGGLCGTGHYVLLEKGADGWKMIKRSMVWIS